MAPWHTDHPLKILLIGNTGQLGWELERTLAPLGEVIACDYPAIDLTSPDSLHSLVTQSAPGLIINAAAYTAVDRAEKESELARAINATAPPVLAEEASRLGAALIHYSTDYVFDGELGRPYVETDQPNPLGVYGQTKLDGEEGVRQVGGAWLVLRTSWVYSLRRDSFVSKVLAWSRSQSSMKLVTDQVSGPTWARMLAEITSQLVLLGGDELVDWFSEHHGLYHLAGDGYCSRFDWGQEILRRDPHKEAQVVKELLPALTSDFPTPARRPLFSALDCSLFTHTFHLKLPGWEAALKLAMETQ